jgi:hypothetical protein
MLGEPRITRAQFVYLVRPGCAALLNELAGYEPHPLVMVEDIPVRADE